MKAVLAALVLVASCKSDSSGDGLIDARSGSDTGGGPVADG